MNQIKFDYYQQFRGLSQEDSREAGYLYLPESIASWGFDARDFLQVEIAEEPASLSEKLLFAGSVHEGNLNPNLNRLTYASVQKPLGQNQNGVIKEQLVALDGVLELDRALRINFSDIDFNRVYANQPFPEINQYVNAETGDSGGPLFSLQGGFLKKKILLYGLASSRGHFCVSWALAVDFQNGLLPIEQQGFLGHEIGLPPIGSNLDQFLRTLDFNAERERVRIDVEVNHSLRKEQTLWAIGERYTRLDDQAVSPSTPEGPRPIFREWLAQAIASLEQPNP